VQQNASGFWINHGAFQMHRLELIIGQIKQFLANTQKEIVIFDVQEFPHGFANENIHRLLVDFLHTQFADYIIPRLDKGEIYLY